MLPVESAIYSGTKGAIDAITGVLSRELVEQGDMKTAYRIAAAHAVVECGRDGGNVGAGPCRSCSLCIAGATCFTFQPIRLTPDDEFLKARDILPRGRPLTRRGALYRLGASRRGNSYEAGRHAGDAGHPGQMKFHCVPLPSAAVDTRQQRSSHMTTGSQAITPSGADDGRSGQAPAFGLRA